MKEVSLRQVEALVRGARLAGFDLATLSPLSACQELERDPGGRIDWCDFVCFMDRYSDVVGGPAGFDRVGAVWPQLFPWVKAIAKTFSSGRDFYRFFLGAASQSAFLNLSFTLIDLGHALKFDVVLSSNDADCPPFWHVNRSVFRAGALFLDEPLADVEADVYDHRASYLIVVPESSQPPLADSDIARLTKEVEAAHLGIMRAYGEIQEGNQVGDSLHFAGRLATLSKQWDLTAREMDVLRVLAGGVSNKDAAEQLSCSLGTVEVHLRRLFSKSGAGSRSRLIAMFWAGV